VLKQKAAVKRHGLMQTIATYPEHETETEPKRCGSADSYCSSSIIESSVVHPTWRIVLSNTPREAVLAATIVCSTNARLLPARYI
jgi:hypothetical protein